LPAFVNPYAVVTMKSHVLITLEMKNSYYNKWVLFKYTSTASLVCADDLYWGQIDCHIRS
jgi:hypothetical protein